MDYSEMEKLFEEFETTGIEPLGVACVTIDGTGELLLVDCYELKYNIFQRSNDSDTLQSTVVAKVPVPIIARGAGGTGIR